MAGNTVKVTDQTFEELVLKSDKPVLVDFWATWCPPCRAIAPILEELAGTYADDVVIAKLDSDENPRVSAQYGVMALPTIVVFHQGKVREQFVGARPKSFYTSIIKDLMAQAEPVQK